MTDRVSWSHPKVMTALMAVFLAGAAVGAFAMKQAGKGAFGNASRVMQKMERKELLEYFQKELSLTDKQQQQVSSLLDDHFKYLQTLGAQMEEVRMHGRESIAKCLEPEQRRKFDKLMLDWQRAQK
jgi:Spy/CpxP family protein refolding chaperone